LAPVKFEQQFTEMTGAKVNDKRLRF